VQKETGHEEEYHHQTESEARQESEPAADDHRHGPVAGEGSVATTKKAMTEKFSRRGRMRSAMEVGTHSPWVSRLLASLGHEVIVANARQVRLITHSTRKDDKLDARMLARLARGLTSCDARVVAADPASQREGARAPAGDSRTGGAGRCALQPGERGARFRQGDGRAIAGLRRRFARRGNDGRAAGLKERLRPLLDR
jgi:transposase